MTVMGRYTGILRDDLANAFDSDAQDFPGVNFSSGLYRANLRRVACTGNVSALTTAVMTSVPLYLREGDLVTNLTFVSATTALGTGANRWFALYDPDGDLLAQSADQTSTAWAANTKMTQALTAPQTIQDTGWHRAAIMVKASQVPTLVGVTLVNAVASAALITGEKVLSQTSDSALTDTAPATIGTPTAIAGVPLVIAT